MRSRKPIQLRVPADVAAQVAAVADVEDKSVNQAVVEAIEEAIVRRRSDKDFQARLERAIQRNREALELLAK